MPDALTLGAIALAISAFAGVFIWAINDGKRESERRLNADIERLTVANKHKDAINEAQASPYPDAAASNSWLRSRKDK